MLLRCKVCKVLMGLRHPFDDWQTDQESICAGCAYVHLDAHAFPPPAQHQERKASENEEGPP